jgi:hypothetical protein
MPTLNQVDNEVKHTRLDRNDFSVAADLKALVVDQ